MGLFLVGNLWLPVPIPKLPIAVTVSTLLIIWLVAPFWSTGAWLLGAILAALLIRHTPSTRDLGLQWSTLLSTLIAWWWIYLLCFLSLVALVDWRGPALPSLTRGLVYFAECVVQQLIFQHLICAPLVRDLGATEKSDWAAATLFSIVHFPNPVLLPATLLWGATAANLFRHRRSLWAVAILQYLLSGILYALIPYSWFHGFRIGPRYFQP